MAEEPRIVPGKYNPIMVQIAADESESEKINLGSKSIMGIYVQGYVGTIYFNGSMTEDGLNLTGNPNALPSEFSYARIQKPDDATGAEYTITSDSDFALIPVDYTVFATPNFITLELDAAHSAVTIWVQCYDV